MAEDFYSGEIDLRYPEIAYNRTPINRVNPGVIPFYIPALYPYGNNSIKTSKTIQKASNIKNQEKNITVGNVNISGCINITVPRELCGFVGDNHTIKGEGSQKGTTNVTYGNSHTYNLNIQSSGGSPHSHAGTVNTGNGNIISGEYNSEMNMKGHFNFYPDDDTIPKDSAWVVVFIGGDITRPVIISRYYGS